MTLQEEIQRRRTFAIISHPDAGKTTLTEKFLLYGGAIAQAGVVKGKKNSRAAVSDWMEIEKQRGISVTSSVLQFSYNGYCINILDTPGHQDFSEDTYRTLMAADSAVMVIDAAKGVEPQTRKLFKVCTLRHIPIFTFINKMDRDARDPFELCEQIEQELGIETCPINWPIGSGKEFQGVYDRPSGHILRFTDTSFKSRSAAEEIELSDPKMGELIGEDKWHQLQEEVDLLGAGAEFDLERVRSGQQSPVFFGSALTTFGVEPFLNEFLNMTTPPLPRKAGDVEIDPFSPDFSAFIFKIQANMNKAHRDRIAFMRITSGKFTRDMEVYHVQGGKKQRLSLCKPGKKFKFEGIPTFAPEHFTRVSPKDTMKRKQFIKGTEQIAQEGAIQIFKVPNTGMEEVIVGVVGTLQFDVFQYRMKNEYGVDLRMYNLPYQFLRFIDQCPCEPKDLMLSSDAELLEDYRGRSLLVFSSYWSIDFNIKKNPGLVLSETRSAEE